MNNYCVYEYVFEDGMTYIGLTRQTPIKRHWEHRSTCHGRIKSAVLRHSKISGLPFPNMNVLIEGLTKESAQYHENELVSKIPEEYRLNVAKTGVGIGATGCPEGDVQTPKERYDRQRRYITAHREEIRKWTHSYYLTYYTRNRQKLLDYQKKYRAEHKQKIFESQRAYRQANKDRISANKKAYRLANIARIKARDRIYRATNRDVLIAKSRRRKWISRFLKSISMTSVKLLEYHPKKGDQH